MDTKTNIKNHWIIDKELSNCNSLGSKYQIIIDDLQTRLNNLKKDNINTSKTLLEVNEKEERTKEFFEIFKKIDKLESISNDYITSSQNWIGHIIEIFNDEFSAKLIDKKNPTTYEIATFNFKDVSEGDRNLLKKGALFYWSIGYATTKGQISKQSLLRFKRSVIPVDEFDSIMDKADDLNQNLIWD